MKEQPEPHCSYKVTANEIIAKRTPQPMIQQEQLTAENFLRRSEAGKADIHKVPGRSPISVQALHSALLDEDYLIVGSHVDEITRRKIGSGEYVDFSKLMPKDRVNLEEDVRMEMINKGGMSYWVPMSERDNTVISSYSRWEQAYRVYCNIFTAYHPGKAGELIQYGHTIYTASTTFIWDNVYKYDREFRIHMVRHHLRRSWSVILQQAWSMFLKDKIHTSNNGTTAGTPKVRRKLCFDFNYGECTYGK